MLLAGGQAPVPKRISHRVAMSRHLFADVLHLIAEPQLFPLRLDAECGSFSGRGRLVFSTEPWSGSTELFRK